MVKDTPYRKEEDPRSIRICLNCPLPECRHAEAECGLAQAGLMTGAQWWAGEERMERAAERGAVPCPAK
jgi:hypothetical protein